MSRSLSLAAFGFAAAALVSSAHAADAVRFGTDWFPQAEHGGYYQAVADGTYAKYGLDVTIVPGGPDANNEQLLFDGQLDFYMGSSTGALAANATGKQTVTLAAIFQKDPQVLIANRETGYSSIDQLAGASKYLIGDDGLHTYFAWLQAKFPAFTSDKVAPYNFSTDPFIADKTLIQQGYLTSEPYEIEAKTGTMPLVFLFADAGYATYANTIETMKPWYDANKDVAKRFVEASIIGWYNYLYGDRAAADAAILKANPELTQDRLDTSVKAMKAFGLVNSGDAEMKGIGCINPDRWNQFATTLAEIGVIAKGIDSAAALDTSLVCQGLGKDLVK